MNNLKVILLCSQVNFRKWLVNPRIYTLAVITIAFLSYHSLGLSKFAAEKEIAITPWVFPFLSIPPTMQVFACFIVLLFCDAPFADRHMPFLTIRTSRRNWIIGQLIYIILASFIYTIFVCVMSAIVLIPNLQLSTGWGVLIKTLAVKPDIAPSVLVFFDEEIIKMFSPIKAILISSGLFWLVAVFIGVLIFFFNVVIKKMSGLVASGFFIFMSFFSIIQGILIFGEWIRYLSPISWMNISYLYWNGFGFATASPTFAVLCLLIAILLMGIISTIVFCKKDMNIHGWGD
ncbi:hypothetical protein KHA93_19725 [Bacillus sp. FJAT-49732]|uniref:Uncharacterized protein n=1 Tax=Lederbergia citrisecunda TaxID=2833583 RepID=A0A942TQS3_9BACI|nr:hypothetical protein [Lederbergia citrisecunda]MBS4201838.1 hypothetical protein [Lederbergia citrisecunda]